MKRIAWVALAFLITPVFAGDQESPLSVDGVTTVDVEGAKALFDQGVPFVDVRSDKDWEAGRIPGAEHMELKSAFDAKSLGAIVSTGDPVVFYCNGAKCLRSAEASEKAVEWGFSRVHYFRDGYPAWQGAGYPVE